MTYTPPTPQHIPNEIMVDRPFDEVWDQLVEQLAQVFFSFDIVDKESRLINFSFNAENPEEYIDCGESHRVYSKDGRETRFDYPTAASSSYVAGAGGGTKAETCVMDRAASLRGFVNIYVAPKGDKTLVTVNVRYVLDIDVSGTCVAVTILDSSQSSREAFSATYMFRTNQDYTVNWGTAEDPTMGSCCSNGTMESLILGMVGQ